MIITFKDRLANFLNKNNLTVDEFAKKAGIKPSRVNKWVNGAVPRCTTLISIVKALKISADEFLGLSDKH